MTELAKQGQFLPPNYKTPDNASQFMKLEPGDNTVRILSQPLVGYVIFTNEGKPIRREYDPQSSTYGDFTKDELTEFNAKTREDGSFEGSRHFWIMLVWSYKHNAPKVLDVTQKTVLRDINGLVSDEAWGDPRQYDINISRKGTGRTDTEYTITPKPHKKPAEDIVKFAMDCQETDLVDLRRIWKGEYPFKSYTW